MLKSSALLKYRRSSTSEHQGQPGTEGKWFASAKDAALELARCSPTDPQALDWAARDFAAEWPGFAVTAGLIALY